MNLFGSQFRTTVGSLRYGQSVFVLCFFIVLLDGFDTAAIGYIAPSLITEWGVSRPELAPVLSAALVVLALTLGMVVFLKNSRFGLALQAVRSRDYPVLQGAILLFALVFLVINLLVDLLYGRIDPRIRR